MLALHLAGEKWSVRDLPRPIPEKGEALVRIRLAGICSTDLERCRGYYPYDGILGHEFVGEVEQCAGAPEWVGRRVVATINFSPACGGQCGRRCPEQCPDRAVMGIVGRDGIFAEYATIPVANLLEVPESLSDEEAVFAEPLAAACRIPEQVDLTGREAVVIGPGRLGILCAQVLRHQGADVSIVGRSERSLTLCRDFDFKAGHEAPAPESADLVVECTANESGLRTAIEIVRPNGTVVLKSTYADDLEENPFAKFGAVLASAVVKEITLVGSRCGPFDTALHLLAEEAVKVIPLIEATYPLAEAVDALKKASEPGVRKVLLRP